MINWHYFVDWLKKAPKVSSLLLIATYGVFGWLYSSWMIKFAFKLQLIYEWIKPQFALATSYGIGLLCIFLIIKFFTTPITLFTLGMESWFRIDARAFFAIAISIIIFAIIVEHPVALSRFLVLSAAAILFRLDLQTLGCPKIIARIILAVLCSIAFTTGVGLFYFYGI